MPPSLRLLMRLQLRGLFRGASRKAKTARGKLFFVFGILVILLWLAPTLLTANLVRSPVEQVRNVMPLALFGITVLGAFTSAGEKAIAFTGGETDFLFPGPYTRRQLLVYKLFKGVSITLLVSLILSVALLRHATHWLACYVGCLLTLQFVQLSGTAMLLIAQRLGERVRSRGKMLATAGLALLGWAVLRAAIGPQGWAALLDDPRAVLQGVAQSDLGQVVLAPFILLSRVITVEQLWPDLLQWGLAGLAMDLLLVGIVVQLDSLFIEAAAGASERRYERLRRLRSGGQWAPVSAKSGRRSLPSLPRWGGSGIIAWRQLTHAVRASRSLLTVLLVLSLSVGPVLVSSGRSGRPISVLAPILVAMIWVAILLASVLRFDFRADLDAIETLKALPLRPAAVAAGQLVAPTLVMTLIHWLLIATTLFVTRDLPVGKDTAGPLLVCGVLALPFNALMFAAENIVFLLAPNRPSAAGPGDFSTLGRQIFTLAIRTLGVGVASAVAAAIAVPIYILLGHSLALATAAAFVVLSLEVVGAIPILGMLFNKFDPSRHMPE